VRVFGHEAQEHLLAGAADEHRSAGAAGTQHLQRALEVGEPLAHRRQFVAVAEVAPLALVPAGADADDDPAAARGVDGRRGLGEQPRVAVERTRHDLAEPDPRGLARERREGRPALEHPVRVASTRLQVVVQPDRVETELLSAPRDGTHRLEVAPLEVLAPALRDDQPEAHQATTVPGGTPASGRTSLHAAWARGQRTIASSSSETTTSVPASSSFAYPPGSICASRS